MKKLLLFSCSLLMSNTLYASIKIGMNTVIKHYTIYKHVSLDLTNGNFIIKNNATLNIHDSEIIGVLSPTNKTLIYVEKGKLNLHNNKFTISTSNIPPHPESQSLSYVVRVDNAKLRMAHNQFTIDTPFTAGLLITNKHLTTKAFDISYNQVNNFHGVFYLLNSENAVIKNNTLNKNSFGNIVINGKDALIENNVVLFSGRDSVGDGDAIDVIGSEKIKISNNVIATSACYGIWVIASQAVEINSNTITGGVTYAISIKNPVFDQLNHTLLNLTAYRLETESPSSDISITNNNFHQNRYGISAENVNHLNIRHNSFTQRFKNDATRKFWTDNTLLLKNISELIWEDNVYKEAFTQENNGDNSKSKFVTFPKFGGVVLN